MKAAGIIFLFVLGAIGACSTDIDLLNSANPLPAVYCQINPSDKFVYLTATKTFSGKGNAAELARDSETVFFTTVDIRLELWVGEYRITEISFEPVTRQKVPGLFSDQSGYCFRANISSDPVNHENLEFRLVVQAPELSSPAYAQISVIGPPVIRSVNDKQISFYPSNYDFAIIPGTGTAYCDLSCNFRYKEFTGVWEDRTVNILLKRDLQIDLSPRNYISAELFYKRIAAKIRPIHDTIMRKFVSLDLILSAGDKHFKDYVETYVNAGDIDLPPKGNIVNGLGLFTMVRIAKKENMTFDRTSFDSLCLGQYTKHLGFVRW